MLPVQRVGCTHISSWTYGVFNEKTKSHHINILKLYPISLAVFLFSKSWHNKNILFICNNLASIARLLMMKLIRIIVLHALEHNFCIRPKHIPTAHNTACDLLSRFQVENALRLAPHLDPLPLPIPHHALRAYFLVRGDQNGTLFVSSLSSPFSFVKFRSVFKELLNNETTTITKTNNATITSIQKSSPQPITEIGQWNRAFQAPHLFRYMSIIQHLTNTSKHWQLYDEKFRKLRAVSPSIPWGIIHTETYLFCSILNQPFRGPSNKRLLLGLLGTAESQSALSPTIVATVKDPMALHVAQNHSIYQRDTLSTHQTFKSQATLQPKSENIYKLPTPVIINTLAPYLDGYDTDKTHFVVTGFNQGVSLGTADYIPPRVSQNHSSVHINLAFVRNKLASEVTRGRIKGPYITPPLLNLVCSPLGAVPKRAKNSFRLIHDLLFPSSTAMPSVNYFIPKYDSVVTLETFDHSSKTVFPNTQVEVHGILVDTNSLTAILPPDKVQLLRTLLESFKKRKKVTLKQLQSLLGHLNFACKVIKPGRCFLRRLYDLTIRCTNQTRADIALWHKFLNEYNGCTLFTGDRFTTSTTLKLFTDAAGSKGFACTHRSSWTFVKQHHINILELYPIALAVTMFGHLWQNTHICFICDNMAVVYCLNKQSSKDKIMMKLIRNIVLSALENNFCFQAKRISTKKNTICDLLFRLQPSLGCSVSANCHVQQKVPIMFSKDFIITLPMLRFAHFETLQIFQRPSPVRALLRYLNLTSHTSGSLSVHTSGKPVTTTYFRSILRSCTHVCSLNPRYYTTHSFRIGEATHAFHNKMSTSNIQSLGR
ncbi:hypothetical protein MAR_008464 [Mya arenaria]|uniref:Uncharacterized protein n=1 Tax=Mya arenaria TaxID=6604 RepID=A0ABY7E088_MYAAR|nr:hypothetical protein MAR_008464 [Mya arenaria]